MIEKFIDIQDRNDGCDRYAVQSGSRRQIERKEACFSLLKDEAQITQIVHRSGTVETMFCQ
jgi:hypothetical protein